MSADGTDRSASDYRHGDKRKNLPAARISGEGRVPAQPKVRDAFSPHLDPILRFDPTGRTLRSWRARRSLTCSWIGISEISSKKSVPPCACINFPSRAMAAPVKAPFS